MVHFNNCPVCGSSQISFCFHCTDNSISKQEFALWECKECAVRFTREAPGQDEIGPYYQSEAYVSHTNSQKGIINRIYHVVRKITMQNKRRLVNKVSGKLKGKLLDIGAGTGMFLKTMQDAGWEVLGLEPDEDTRNRASEIHQVELQPVESLFILPQKYDVVTMWHVLEHVHQLHEYIKKIETLIAEGGHFMIAVPNYTSFDGYFYGKDWAAYDVPRHLYHFSPASMNKLLAMHGFKVITCKPMWFDSFYVSMLTEKYKRSSLGVIRAMFTAFYSNLKALFNPEKCSSVIYIAEKGK